MSFFSYLCITLMTRVCRGNEEEKTGPNDASGIVWALGMVFFVFFFHFIDNKAGRGITLYRTIRFKERIQCIGPSEFTGPRESVNVIPNWEECITGNYWAYYTHRVALGDAAHDAGTKLLPRKCR